MTGWTQFTVRFEEAKHADAIIEDAEASPHRAPYAESEGDVARIRLLGYDKHEPALKLLRAAGPFSTALVADFNDTSDSGRITVYRGDPEGHTPSDTLITEGGSLGCPAASRWSFEVSVSGLTETGQRAGNDFELSEMY